jgi:ribonuclease Z
MPVSLEALQPGPLDLDGFGLEVRRQIHPGGSAGFRVGKRLAFITDTIYDPGAVDFLRGVDLLLHEAWVRSREDDPDLQDTLASHTSAADAGRLAAKAGAGELLLIHLNPLKDAAYHAAMLARAREEFPAAHLAYDGWTRLLPD